MQTDGIAGPAIRVPGYGPDSVTVAVPVSRVTAALAECRQSPGGVALRLRQVCYFARFTSILRAVNVLPVLSPSTST